MNTLNFLILTIILLVFTPTSFSSIDDQWYNNCGQNFTCGSINVGFPFWGSSSRLRECGYPSLELTCEDGIKTTIQMSNMKFYVLQITQTEIAHMLTIARQDLTKGICLQSFANTTLNYDEFYYAMTTQNITVLYGCPPLEQGSSGKTSSDPSSDPTQQMPLEQGSSSYTAQFNCKINGTKNTAGTFQQGVTGPNGCYESVFVPIYGSLEGQIVNASTLSQVIDKGFEVNYKLAGDDVAMCNSCEISKGRCGYDLGTNHSTCVCPDGSSGYTPCALKSQISPKTGSKIKKGHRKLSIVLIVCLSAAGMCMLLILVLYVKRRYSSDGRGLEVFQRQRKLDIEAFLKNNGSPGLKRFTYTHLKKITNSFKNKIGEGGYGSVYKGRLKNGNLVAVKMLHKSKANAGDFLNEVESVGNTNHVNVVKLFGFCYEGKRQALVYEFMANGSLEKSLFTSNNSVSLGLKTLFEIAIGVARGLEYLHRGCNTRILHFDIKPHNILLDENFRPKISDFGLAKSCPQKESIILSMSEARGTVGYIAPEVFLKSFGGVSYKSDVYSYGMLVLEMVGCRRRKATIEGEHSTEQYFPQWIYEQLEGGEEPNQEVVLSNEESEMQRRMIVVSLWCIQTNPSSRPAMSKVVEMLEGTLELQIPAPSTLSLSLFESLRSQQLNTLTDSLSRQVQNKTT